MTITKIKNGEDLTLQVEGRIDSTTAPELEIAVTTDMEGVKNLTFDFEKTDYISSAGLRVILLAQKYANKVQGSMKLTNVSDDIKEILDVTGFSEIITIV